jgi:nucleotide-binding universal stress UspA family protein
MKILVPLDGSEMAETAIPVALNLARGSRAALVLLTVSNREAPSEAAPADLTLAPIREAQSYLEAARSHLAGDVEVSAAVWRGIPSASILAAADAHGADTIVMASHGRSGREREMFGSVAEAVLREAPMTVVVVRPKRQTRKPSPVQV